MLEKGASSASLHGNTTSRVSLNVSHDFIDKKLLTKQTQMLKKLSVFKPSSKNLLESTPCLSKEEKKLYTDDDLKEE